MRKNVKRSKCNRSLSLQWHITSLCVDPSDGSLPSSSASTTKVAAPKPLSFCFQCAVFLTRSLSVVAGGRSCPLRATLPLPLPLPLLAQHAAPFSSGPCMSVCSSGSSLFFLICFAFRRMATFPGCCLSAHRSPFSLTSPCFRILMLPLAFSATLSEALLCPSA